MKREFDAIRSCLTDAWLPLLAHLLLRFVLRAAVTVVTVEALLLLLSLTVTGTGAWTWMGAGRASQLRQRFEVLKLIY